MKFNVQFLDGTSMWLQERIPYQFYRYPHDIERVDSDGNHTYRGNGNWTGFPRAVVREKQKPFPEVYRLGGSHETLLADPWVWLWRKMNPLLTDEKFCTLLGWDVWLCNNTGFPGRRNIILGEELDQKPPAFHASIVTGGNIFKGVEHNGILLIENLRTSDPVPSPEWVLERPWLWFWGTSVYPDGRVGYIKRAGADGTMHRVKVPFLTRLPVWLPLNQLQKLPPGYIPPAADTFALANGEVTGKLT